MLNRLAPPPKKPHDDESPTNSDAFVHTKINPPYIAPALAVGRLVYLPFPCDRSVDWRFPLRFDSSAGV